jgi:UDP-N-acetylglucosamine/UDP-N-acetyl-alpha-D-glucosaminouronate 4-epimerase
VFASSSSTYGANPTLPKQEDMATQPIAPYAVSKLAAEGYCIAFHRVYGLQTVALRYFNIFGPRQDPSSQYSAVIPKFITAILQGEAPTVHGDGEQTRDFTYIDNAVEANLRAADADGSACGRAFNIACGERISLNEVIQVLAELAGREVTPTYVDPRPGDVRDSLADISAAREALGYEPKVDVAEGLRRVYEHHRDGLKPVAS